MEQMKEIRCVLALGGNLGNPENTFRIAIRALEKSGFRVESVSNFLPNPAVECEKDAPPFLNAVLTGYWKGSPRELLALCQQIEACNGRPNSHKPSRSRTLDLDVILFGSLTMQSPDLTIPHPRAAERDFVMIPLREIAPELAGVLSNHIAVSRGSC